MAKQRRLVQQRRPAHGRSIFDAGAVPAAARAPAGFLEGFARRPPTKFVEAYKGRSLPHVLRG